MKPFPKRALAAVIFALVTGILATACNTIRGLGQDTERAGEKIQDATR